MQLKNLHVDRILTSEEVKAMLAEDSKKENADIRRIKKKWDESLKNILIPEGQATDLVECDLKIQVSAWKIESSYVFEDSEGRQYFTSSLRINRRIWRASCVTELCHLTQRPSTRGLSFSEIEDAMKGPKTPIACLLDAGFRLDLLVPTWFLKG